MIRGTTPTHIFNIPFDVAAIDELKITYAQWGNIVITKNKSDCTLEGTTIKTSFTQEETFKFSSDKPVEIQVRILTVDGEALASIIQKVDVGRCLDSEVLT